MVDNSDKVACPTPDARRRDVAVRLYQAAFKITDTALAKIYGVSQPTINSDRHSDAYWDELDNLMDNRMYEVQHKAWEVIRKAIDDGDKGVALELLKNTDKRFVRQLRAEIVNVRAPADEVDNEISDILRTELERIELSVEFDPSDNGSGNGNKGNGEATIDDPAI